MSKHVKSLHNDLIKALKKINSDVVELNPKKNKVLKKLDDQKTNKVWVRLGGHIQLTDQEIQDLETGDDETKEYIIETALRRGYEASGEVYDPENEDWGFELSGSYKLKL